MKKLINHSKRVSEKSRLSKSIRGGGSLISASLALALCASAGFAGGPAGAEAAEPDIKITLNGTATGATLPNVTWQTTGNALTLQADKKESVTETFTVENLYLLFYDGNQDNAFAPIWGGPNKEKKEAAFGLKSQASETSIAITATKKVEFGSNGVIGNFETKWGDGKTNPQKKKRTVDYKFNGGFKGNVTLEGGGIDHTYGTHDTNNNNLVGTATLVFGGSGLEGDFRTRGYTDSFLETVSLTFSGGKLAGNLISGENRESRDDSSGHNTLSVTFDAKSGNEITGSVTNARGKATIDFKGENGKIEGGIKTETLFIVDAGKINKDPKPITTIKFAGNGLIEGTLITDTEGKKVAVYAHHRKDNTRSVGAENILVGADKAQQVLALENPATQIEINKTTQDAISVYAHGEVSSNTLKATTITLGNPNSSVSALVARDGSNRLEGNAITIYGKTGENPAVYAYAEENGSANNKIILQSVVKTKPSDAAAATLTINGDVLAGNLSASNSFYGGEDSQIQLQGTLRSEGANSVFNSEPTHSNNLYLYTNKAADTQKNTMTIDKIFAGGKNNSNRLVIGEIVLSSQDKNENAVDQAFSELNLAGISTKITALGGKITTNSIDVSNEAQNLLAAKEIEIDNAFANGGENTFLAKTLTIKGELTANSGSNIILLTDLHRVTKNGSGNFSGGIKIQGVTQGDTTKTARFVANGGTNTILSNQKVTTIDNDLIFAGSGEGENVISLGSTAQLKFGHNASNRLSVESGNARITFLGTGGIAGNINNVGGSLVINTQGTNQSLVWNQGTLTQTAGRTTLDTLNATVSNLALRGGEVSISSKSKNATSTGSRHFNLLTVGVGNDSLKGFEGSNGSFVLYADIKNATSKAETNTLGGTTGKGYGNAYSDRVIIEKKTGSASSSLKLELATGITADDLKAINYDASKDTTSSGGGTNTAGNIALVTMKNTDGVVDFGSFAGGEIVDAYSGFDKVQVSLVSKATTKAGIVSATTTENTYTTLFAGSAKTAGLIEADVAATTSAFMLNYDLWMANFNSINKRMGELRNNPKEQGVWVRVFNGSQDNDFGLGTTSKYTTIQGGYDYAFGFEGANNYLGLALSYAMSKSETKSTALKDNFFAGLKDISSNAVEFAVYNSYVGDGVKASELNSENWASGFYNDTIAKFSYIFSDFSVLNDRNQKTNSTLQKYDVSNIAFSLSDEVGYLFKLGENGEWGITPQAEVGIGYLSQGDFKQIFGDAYLKAQADKIINFRSRVGSSFSYDFKNFTADKDVNAQIYLGTYYEYDIISGGELILTSNAQSYSTDSYLKSNGRFALNVGTNVEVKDSTRIYFDFEKSFGGKINTDYQVNVGVRYSFGESANSRVVETTEKKQSAPLEVENKKDKEEKAETKSDTSKNEE